MEQWKEHLALVESLSHEWFGFVSTVDTEDALSLSGNGRSKGNWTLLIIILCTEHLTYTTFFWSTKKAGEINILIAISYIVWKEIQD